MKVVALENSNEEAIVRFKAKTCFLVTYAFIIRNPEPVEKHETGLTH